MISYYEPLGHRSDMVAFNGILFVAGMVATDLSKSVEGQCAEILDKIDAHLAKANSSKGRLLNATIWLADVADRAKIASVWNDWLLEGRQPARACIGASLGKGVKIEIAVVAAAEV